MRSSLNMVGITKNVKKVTDFIRGRVINAVLISLLNQFPNFSIKPVWIIGQ